MSNVSARLCMKYLVATLTLCLCASALADSQPARIGEHDASLAKRIKFPQINGDVSLFLRCEAKVLPAGSIEEVGCYSNPEVDDAFFRAVYLGSTNATMLPASVDGQNVAVLALFSVAFRQQDGQRVVAIIPNHGTNVKSLGMNYIAPQRYGRNNQYLPRGELGLLWIDAEITAAGKARDISYVETEWTNKETKRYARHYVKNNTFIPGHVGGQPTTMRFVKPVFGYRNGFMVDAVKSKCGDSLVACNETSGATGRPRFVFDD